MKKKPGVACESSVTGERTQKVQYMLEPRAGPEDGVSRMPNRKLAYSVVCKE